MPKGNPNPSPATRFQPGNVANPGGMSAAVRARNDRTADLASQIRERLISATMEKLDSGIDLFELLTPEVIRIVKDSEDRAHGTPKSAIDHTSSDRSMTPSTFDPSKLSTAALAELQAAMNASPETDEG
jgi:hypothetical protein